LAWRARELGETRGNGDARGTAVASRPSPFHNGCAFAPAYTIGSVGDDVRVVAADRKGGRAATGADQGDFERVQPAVHDRRRWRQTFQARMHLRLAVLMLGCATGVTSSARADEQKSACIAAHADSQVLRNASHLRAARAKLQTCADGACPAIVTADCTQWLDEIDQEQPSIVVAAKDEHGQDIVAMATSIDGEVVATRLDGTAIAVDPGEHELRGRLPDGRLVVHRFVATESVRARVISLVFSANVASVPPAKPVASIPTLSWVFGGVGLASAAPWAIFGVLGWTDKAQLDSSCKGSCTGGQIDDVRRDFLIADISAGVSIAAIAVAVIVAIVVKPHAARTAGSAVLFGGSF
jgi:hypothetical protein